jgi:hypothetical protein
VSGLVITTPVPAWRVLGGLVIGPLSVKILRATTEGVRKKAEEVGMGALL